jgi:hypothetical protein
MPWFSRVHREFEAGSLTRAFRDMLLALGRFDLCRLGIFPSHPPSPPAPGAASGRS